MAWPSSGAGTLKQARPLSPSHTRFLMTVRAIASCRAPTLKKIVVIWQCWGGRGCTKPVEPYEPHGACLNLRTILLCMFFQIQALWSCTAHSTASKATNRLTFQSRSAFWTAEQAATSCQAQMSACGLHSHHKYGHHTLYHYSPLFPLLPPFQHMVPKNLDLRGGFYPASSGLESSIQRFMHISFAIGFFVFFSGVRLAAWPKG